MPHPVSAGKFLGGNDAGVMGTQDMAPLALDPGLFTTSSMAPCGNGSGFNGSYSNGSNGGDGSNGNGSDGNTGSSRDYGFGWTFCKLQ